MRIKRGDSFLLALVARVDGVRQDLTNWEVRAAIGTCYGVVDEITVAFTNRAQGEFELSADTTEWPIGVLEFDIRYTTDVGQIVTTNSVKVDVVKSDTP